MFSLPSQAQTQPSSTTTNLPASVTSSQSSSSTTRPANTAATSQATTTPNELLLGEKSSIAGTIDIPIHLPIELDYMTKAQVRDLRSRCVQATQCLLAGPYIPHNEIFGHMEDKKPWWGIAGQSVWGAGPKSNEGASEESRFILNPFLLAGANPAVLENWKPDKIEPADLTNPDFPFCWEPSLIRLYPKERLEQVVYEVSAFNAQLEVWKAKKRVQSIFPAFGIVAYNARDFNFNYIYWDPTKSIHVENIEKVADEATPIRQMIHCGGTCKIPGGCNNMSPAMKSIDRIKYTALPARVCVLLWQNKPGSIHDKPDMTVYLDLK